MSIIERSHCSMCYTSLQDCRGQLPFRMETQRVKAIAQGTIRCTILIMGKDSSLYYFAMLIHNQCAHARCTVGYYCACVLELNDTITACICTLHIVLLENQLLREEQPRITSKWAMNILANSAYKRECSYFDISTYQGIKLFFQYFTSEKLFLLCTLWSNWIETERPVVFGAQDRWATCCGFGHSRRASCCMNSFQLLLPWILGSGLARGGHLSLLP